VRQPARFRPVALLHSASRRNTGQGQAPDDPMCAATSTAASMPVVRETPVSCASVRRSGTCRSATALNWRCAVDANQLVETHLKQSHLSSFLPNYKGYSVDVGRDIDPGPAPMLRLQRAGACSASLAPMVMRTFRSGDMCGPPWADTLVTQA
jgi:hypothetical protein